MLWKTSLDHKNAFLGRKMPILATYGPHFGPKIGFLGQKNFKKTSKNQKNFEKFFFFYNAFKNIPGP